MTGIMISSLIAATLLLVQQTQPVPGLPERPANLPELNAEQTANLRCAVNFAMLAEGQKKGFERALAYPKLGDRGQEFFVRVMAQLMDEAQLSRDDVEALTAYEVQLLRAAGPDGLDAVMPACLSLLDASGL